jgi:hypothetical protein
MDSPRRLAILLWILLFGFYTRVLDQMLAVFAGAPDRRRWKPGNRADTLTPISCHLNF